MATLVPSRTSVLKFRGMLLGDAVMEKSTQARGESREKDSRLRSFAGKRASGET